MARWCHTTIFVGTLGYEMRFLAEIIGLDFASTSLRVVFDRVGQQCLAGARD